jgi:hypothetical protein
MHLILLGKKVMGGTRNLHFPVIKPEVCTMYFVDQSTLQVELL